VTVCSLSLDPQAAFGTLIKSLSAKLFRDDVPVSMKVAV
jgi:hypothetical protein